MRLQSYPIPNTENVFFLIGTVPVIKCVLTGQNANILNIFYVIRRRFRTVLVDTHVPETVSRCYIYAKRVCCKKMPPVLI